MKHKMNNVDLTKKYWQIYDMLRKHGLRSSQAEINAYKILNLDV